MNEAMSNSFRSAVEAYVSAPTRNNRQRLLETAEEYRELWIEARASGGALPKKGSATHESTTTYDRELEVTEIVDGTPVKLALQERTNVKKKKSWWVLSWRTKYSPNGSNRRFYSTKDGFWTIPAETALDMIRQMDVSGGLHEKYFDQRRRSEFETLVSTNMTAAEKEEALARMTAPDEDWGSDPFFVICFDPNSNWKKVMIVNTDDDSATFRSITENPDYMPKKVLRPGEGWWLDNSMMDANVQQMRQLYKYLRDYIDSRAGENTP